MNIRIKGGVKSWDNYHRFLLLSTVYLYLLAYLSTMQFSQSYSKHPFPRCFTVKEDEGRTLWLDTQSHASSSASSADDDYSWQWPTSFWSQFKVSTPCECLQQLPNTMPFYSLKRSLSPRLLHYPVFEDRRRKAIDA